MINRISLNGKRYIASKRYSALNRYCGKYKIPYEWIRFCKNKRSKLFHYFYLRLWGRYRNAREIKSDRQFNCSLCKGTGVRLHTTRLGYTSSYKCRRCKGSGKLDK